MPRQTSADEKKKSLGRRRRAEVVDELLTTIEKKLQEKDAKASLADYIRLLQLQKEMEEDETPREIRVKWVEDSEETSES